MGSSFSLFCPSIHAFIHSSIYPSIHPETAFLTQLTPFYTIFHTLDFKIYFLYSYWLNYHLFAEKSVPLAIISLLRLNSKSPLSLGYLCLPFPTGTKNSWQNRTLPDLKNFALFLWNLNAVKGITLHMVTCARKLSTAHEVSTLSFNYSPVFNCRLRTAWHSGQYFDIFALSLLSPSPPSCCQVLFASGRGCG